MTHGDTQNGGKCQRDMTHSHMHAVRHVHARERTHGHALEARCLQQARHCTQLTTLTSALTSFTTTITKKQQSL